MKAAKKRNHLLDGTLGRKIRSVILFNEGTVMLSCLRFETLLMRLNGDMRGNLFDKDSEYTKVELVRDEDDGVDAGALIPDDGEGDNEEEENEEGEEGITFDEDN